MLSSSYSNFISWAGLRLESWVNAIPAEQPPIKADNIMQIIKL